MLNKSFIQKNISFLQKTSQSIHRLSTKKYYLHQFKLGNSKLFDYRYIQKLLSQIQNKNSGSSSSGTDKETQNLSIAKDSLAFLLADKRIPASVKSSLESDFIQVEKMLEKLEHEYIHIAVLGRVSVGKSSLLNALIDNKQQTEVFSVSPLHGETKVAAYHDWHEYKNGHVILIDTPGINEVDGQEREKLAFDVVSRADVILFVVDGDITHTEYQVLKRISSGVQPVILVLNKADRYNDKEKQLLLTQLRKQTLAFVKPENIVATASTSSVKTFIYVDEAGNETETEQTLSIDVLALKNLLFDLLTHEGKSIAALNATFFAGRLTEQVADHLIDKQKVASANVIKMYCLSKSLAVAVNPVPIVDLFSAALIDVGMIVHLSKVYGLNISRAESAVLIKTIMSQLILLMGTIWLMYLLSSALKLGSFGFSTVLTATGEGAVAYYGTYVVGKAANLYFRQGKSWGEHGPKQAIKRILDGIDRDSIMQQAKEDILMKMNNQQMGT
ncbi:MAG: GTP-binding protein [Gammaproteobacteria bacterium]|nr:GTP-binding protein [Gammaproteobacteria bacterium]